MVFQSGVDPDGGPRFMTTVCPQREIRESDCDAEGFVLWWLEATHWDPMSGTPGLPEWPYRGGLVAQPAKLVEAVNLLRMEWAYVPKRARRVPAKADG